MPFPKPITTAGALSCCESVCVIAEPRSHSQKTKNSYRLGRQFLIFALLLPWQINWKLQRVAINTQISMAEANAGNAVARACQPCLICCHVRRKKYKPTSSPESRRFWYQGCHTCPSRALSWKPMPKPSWRSCISHNNCDNSGLTSFATPLLVTCFLSGPL